MLAAEITAILVLGYGAVWLDLRHRGHADVDEAAKRTFEMAVNKALQTLEPETLFEILRSRIRQ